VYSLALHRLGFKQHQGLRASPQASIFAAEGCHCFACSAHARDNGTIRVNALTGPRLQSCGLITGS
jgi:hypothetical protein